MTIPNTPAFGSVAATVTGTITVPWGSAVNISGIAGVGTAGLPAGDPSAQYQLAIAAVAGRGTASVFYGSPHFSHARFAAIDYRTGYMGANKATEQAFLAGHYDLLINSELDNIKSQFSAMKMYYYDLLVSEQVLFEDNSEVSATDDVYWWGAMDDWLLANDYTVENAWLHTAGTSKTLGNRIYTHLSNFGWRYWPNPGDAGFLAWRQYVTETICAVDGSGFRYDGLFFDEISSGPFGAPETSLEYATQAAYQADIATLLAAHNAWAPSGLNMPNTSTYFTGDSASYITACGAAFGEFVNGAYQENAHTSWTGTAPIPTAMAAGCVVVTTARVKARLRNSTNAGEVGATGATMTVGNYTSVMERLNFCEYANYLMMVDPDNMDRLYLDITCEMNTDVAYPHSYVWMEAFETNIGLATGSASVYQQGTDPHTGFHYHVYRRDFTNALVLHRPLYDYASVDLGDETAVAVDLPAGTWKMLLANGTLGEVVTSVNLREAESAIFMAS